MNAQDGTKMTASDHENPSNSAKNDVLRTVSGDEDGLRVDRWFKRHFAGLSHGQLQKWLRKGLVRLDGKRVDSSDRVASGQVLRLPPFLVSGEGFDTPLTKGGGRPIRDPAKLKAMILYQDDDVIALNKPAGLAVQGGTGLKENLDDSLMNSDNAGEIDLGEPVAPEGVTPNKEKKEKKEKDKDNNEVVI